MEDPQEVLCHPVVGCHMQALVKLNVWKEMGLVNALGEQEAGGRGAEDSVMKC